MTIRKGDLVRQRYTPSGYLAWTGYVGCVEDGRAFIKCGVTPRGVMYPGDPWFPIEMLELVPGQEEGLVA